jgi:hypothetical protein
MPKSLEEEEEKEEEEGGEEEPKTTRQHRIPNQWCIRPKTSLPSPNLYPNPMTPHPPYPSIFHG